MKPCRCFIYHLRTPEERNAGAEALERARSIGDFVGIQITLAQLGPCKSDEVTPEMSEPGYALRRLPNKED